jgi:hypothetical protein
MLLTVLKYARDEALADRLVEVFEIIATGLQHGTALQMLEVVLRYVMHVSPTITPESLRDSFSRGVSKPKLRTEGLTLMPTIAEQCIQLGIEQGIEKGIEQGIEKGRQEGALIGTIEMCRSILGEPTQPGSRESLSREELQQLADRLQIAVRKRLSNL